MSISPLPQRRPRLGLRALASYSPGACDFQSFARGTANATFRDASGLLATAGTITPRARHFENGRLSALLEGARTNALTFTEDISNPANWPRTECTTGTGAPSPTGANSASTVVESTTASVAHYVARSVSFTANTAQACSCFVKAGGRTRLGFYLSGGAGGADQIGVHVNLTSNTLSSNNGGAGSLAYSRIEAWTGGWYRVMFAGTLNGSSTSANLVVMMEDDTGSTVYTGNGISGFYIFGLQFEANQSTASAYIPVTASGSGARSADRLALPFPAAPQECTTFARLTNVEYHLTTSALRAIWLVGTSTTAPRLWLYKPNATAWTFLHDNGTTFVTSVATASAAYGDDVRLRGVLFRDGSVQVGVSVNGAAEVLATRSGALAPAAAWSAAQGWLGSTSTGAFAGTLSLSRLLVLPGVQSLATLAARAP